MPRFAVRLEVRTDRPLTQATLDGLDGGRWDVLATGKARGRSLSVSMEMDGGDVAGALARSMNVVLDQVPGEVRHAEVTQLPDRPKTSRRRRRPGR